MANYQYSVADVIGIQTQGNQAYFADRPDCKIEVLQNWLADAPNLGCSIDVAGGTKNTQDMDCHGAARLAMTMNLYVVTLPAWV